MLQIFVYNSHIIIVHVHRAVCDISHQGNWYINHYKHFFGVTILKLHFSSYLEIASIFLCSFYYARQHQNLFSLSTSHFAQTVWLLPIPLLPYPLQSLLTTILLSTSRRWAFKIFHIWVRCNVCLSVSALFQLTKCLPDWSMLLEVTAK
jgi:hypothetical protein